MIWLFIYSWFFLVQEDLSTSSLGMLTLQWERCYILSTEWENGASSGQKEFSRRRQSYAGAWCFCDNSRILSWVCFEFLPSHEPPKELSEKRCCVLREIPVLWHLLSCWYEPKKLKEQIFQLSSVTKQRTSLSLVPTKGKNSKQSCDSSHRFSLDKQHHWVSWIITFSVEKIEPNLNPAPTRRYNRLKEWDGGTHGTPSSWTITSCDALPQKAPPCPAELPPSPLLTARTPWAEQ